MKSRAKGKLPAQVDRADYNRFFRKNRDWHWAYNVILAGLFIGIFTLAFVGHATVIPARDLSRFLLGCCALGMLVPWKIYRERFELENLEIFLFHLLGTGPLLCAILMWSNFLIRSEEQTLYVPVTHSEVLEEELPHITVFFELENDFLQDNDEYRRYDLHRGNLNLVRSEVLEIRFAKGGLGYDLVLDHRPLLYRPDQEP